MNKPIRVLHVFGGLNQGGAESRIMDIYRQIDKTLIQFDFAVHTNETGFFEEEIQSLGGKVFRGFPPFRVINLFTSYRKWKTFFKGMEYHCLHIHATNSALPVLMAAKACKISIRILHARSASTSNLPRYVLVFLCRPLMRKLSTHCFAVSDKAGKFVFRKNYRVIHNGIPTSLYRYSQDIRNQNREELGIGDCYVLGHVGRFEKVKNHAFLLQVLSLVVSKSPRVCLVLVGDGPLRPEMEQKARELGLQDQILFLGSRTDVPSLLQAFDLFVFPSLYEGMPGAAIEAQAASLACLLSDTITSEAAILSDLVHFLPVNQGAEIWAKEIERCQSRVQKRTNRMEEIRLAGFDICDIAKWYENFYQEVCAERA